MLQYAVTFLIIALVAGALGIWVVAGTASSIAQVLCAIFVIVMVISLFRNRTPKV